MYRVIYIVKIKGNIHQIDDILSNNNGNNIAEKFTECKEKLLMFH